MCVPKFTEIHPSRDVSLKTTNFKLVVALDHGKDEGSSKSVGFVLLEPRMSRQYFMADIKPGETSMRDRDI